MTIGKLSGQCDFGQKGQSYCNQRGQSCVAKRVKVAWLFHHRSEKSAIRSSVRLISYAMSPADWQMACSTLSPFESAESMRLPDIKRASAIRKCRLRTASIRAVVFFPERSILAPLESSSPAISANAASCRQ